MPQYPAVISVVECMKQCKEKIMAQWKSQSGIASFVALAVMLLLAGLGGAMLSASSSEIRTAAAYRDGVAAQYAAEAGAKRAVIELNKNTGNWTGISDVSVGAGKYSVSVAGPMLRRTITSTGTVNGASRQVILDVVPDNAYKYVIYSGQSMNIGGIYVNGSVRSNQDIDLNAATRITGRAIAHGAVSQWKLFDLGTRTNVVKGGVMEEAPILQVPVIGKDTTRAQYRDNVNCKTLTTFRFPRLLLPDLFFYNDDAQLDSNKIYYYEGDDLIISSTVTGPGVIYCTGNVWINNLWGITGKVTNNVIIIAEGDIHFDIGIMTDAVLVAGGDIHVAVSGFTGSAVANGKVSMPLDGTGKPSSNWSAPSNPYIPQPPAWTTDSIGVENWRDQ